MQRHFVKKWEDIKDDRRIRKTSSNPEHSIKFDDLASTDLHIYFAYCQEKALKVLDEKGLEFAKLQFVDDARKHPRLKIQMKLDNFSRDLEFGLSHGTPPVLESVKNKEELIGAFVSLWNGELRSVAVHANQSVEKKVNDDQSDLYAALSKERPMSPLRKHSQFSSSNEFNLSTSRAVSPSSPAASPTGSRPTSPTPKRSLINLLGKSDRKRSKSELPPHSPESPPSRPLKK